MKKKKFMILVMLILALVMGTAVVYAATVVVDSFDSGVQTLSANTSDPIDSEGLTVSGALGDARKSFVYYSGLTGTNVDLNIDATNSNKFSLSIDQDTYGSAKVIWDGNTDVTGDDDIPVYDGLTSLIPSQGNIEDSLSGTPNEGIYVVTSADHLTNLQFTAYGGSSTNNGQLDFDIYGNTNLERLDLFYPFADFSSNGGWDNTTSWASVGAFVMDIDATLDDDLDMGIDNIDARPGSEVREYGDLNAKYGAPVLNAYHIPQGLTLGNNLDAEGVPHPSQYADGDNTNDYDDEDGVSAIDPQDWLDIQVPLPPFDVNGVGSVQILVNGCLNEPCYLSGWIDMDNNDDFAGTWTCGLYTCNEAVAIDLPVNNGTAGVSFETPLVQMTEGWKYARFRICPTAGVCNTPTATAVLNGEVEDYVWYVGGTPTAVNLAAFNASSSNGFIWLAALALLGLLLGSTLVIKKRHN